MAQLFTNNADSELSGTLAQGATSLSLASGTGDKFPSLSGGDFFLLTLFELDGSGDETRIEVVKATARTSDSLTISRDFEDMTGNAGGYDYPSSVGKTVFCELRWTAYAATNAMQKTDNLSGLENAATARTNLGLGNVNNTSDEDKPVSTAQAAAYSAVLSAAEIDATTKANARQAPIGTISGLVKGNGENKLTAAIPGTDFVSPNGNIGTPSSGVLSNCTVDGTNAVGFKTIPQNSKSATYTAVISDSGKHILHPSADTTARTFTIPANASVAYPIGTAITFVNQNGAGVVTIAISTDTMRLAGAGTTGSRTLSPNGIATAIKLNSTEWIISGTGIT